jgi:hypothetical protein
MERWAIYIDIEGSKKVYPKDECKFYAAVDALIDGIGQIGSRVCPENPSRLFAHQTGGDGFVIVSEFEERSPEMPVSIAIVLMQMVLAKGVVAKAGISKGRFGDIQSSLPALGSYPPDQYGRRRLGRGIMTCFPVMGTALINSHRFANRKPPGARLAVDLTMTENLPTGVVISHRDSDFLIVDWVHTRIEAIDEIISKTNIQLPSIDCLQQMLTTYVAETGDETDDEWKNYTLSLNGCLLRS